MLFSDWLKFAGLVWSIRPKTFKVFELIELKKADQNATSYSIQYIYGSNGPLFHQPCCIHASINMAWNHCEDSTA